MLRDRAALHPDRDAIIAGKRRLRYGDLWRRVLAGAWELSRQGVGRGDRVLLTAPSTPAFAIAYLATHAMGAVAVLLDPRAPVARREELIERASPSVGLGVKAESHPRLGQIRAIAEFDPDSGSTSPEPMSALMVPAADDLADLLFTTGTTGRPKGVRLTHGNLAAAARQINAVIGNREGDVEVVPLPLYHSFGLGRLRCNLVAGGTVVLVDGFRLPGEIFSALQKHRATGLAGVPAGFAVLLRFAANGLGLSAGSLRYVEIGSAPMPMDQKRALMALLPNTELWMHYGLTEASRSVFVEFHRHHDRLDTVGIPAPGVRVSVRTDDGAASAAGEPGLLWISGAHVSPGYWDDAALTKRSFAQGWICTGDVASIDASGFITLHGRKDDMINVGGFNVSPDEVEAVLTDHPAIQEAACVGIPDPRKIAGHVVLAYLVPRTGQATVADADLSKWVAARIEPYKVPTQYLWLDSLPRTSSGKLMRKALRTEDPAQASHNPVGRV